MIKLKRYRTFLIFIIALTMVFGVYASDLSETDEVSDASANTESDTESEDREVSDVSANTESNTENEDRIENNVLDIRIPYELPFKIDPIELNGNGQVYSETFRIDNYGKTDVYVHFTNIQYIFANDTDFLSLDKQFDLETESPLKEFYMALEYENLDRPAFVIRDFEQEATEPILLEAAEYDEDGNFVALRETGTVLFSFSGSVNHAPLEPWRSGDVKVAIRYLIEESHPTEISDIEESGIQEQNAEQDTESALTEEQEHPQQVQDEQSPELPEESSEQTPPNEPDETETLETGPPLDDSEAESKPHTDTEQQSPQGELT